MLERHPFGNFVPANAQYLILGSFTGRMTENSYDWFYCSKRNQFWPIMDNVYNIKLKTKTEKQTLLRHLHIAIIDTILQCERKADNNLDTNLTKIVYNTQAIKKILRERYKKLLPRLEPC